MDTQTLKSLFRQKVKIYEFYAIPAVGYTMKRRIDYLYENYVLDKTITIKEFIDIANQAYYKYAGLLYTGIDDNIEPYYSEFFSRIDEGYDIVDIGGGTGFTYNLIQKIEYRYSYLYT